jgi:hypothetical protein
MSQESLHEIDVVERPHDIRIMVSMAGRYSLASRRDGQGNRRVFACRAVNMSANAVVLAAPVAGPVGERVIAHIERFGKIDGSIVRILDDRGFVMSVTATPSERAKIEEKLIWLEKHKNLDLPDNREDERIIPRNPHSTLILRDGTRMSCFVIDMSVTGAAVSAEHFPQIGVALAVGKAVGRVVRRFPEGFAVRFTQPVAPGDLARVVAGS